MATYLDRTFTAGNRKTMTFSAWVKRTGNLGTYAHLFTSSPNPGSWDSIRIENDRKVGVHLVGDGKLIRTNRELWDPHAWYHIVVAIDTTQATASNRVKIYINGEQETDLNSSTYPDQNTDLNFNDNGKTCRIGDNTWSTGNEWFGGLASHWHFTDGTAYTPSAFGSTDSTTGEWKINANPSVTYGTNGFFLFKDNGAVTDNSGQGNNFTASGTGTTHTEDNPSNNFPILNPLFYSPDVNLSHGSTTAVEPSNNWRSAYSSMGVSKGKWYWEAEISYQAGTECYFGIAHEDHFAGPDVTYGSNASAGAPNTGGYDYLGYSTRSFGVYSNGNQDYPSSTTYTGAFNASTYKMSFALDLPNRKLYVARNGIWTNGSNNDWGSSTFDSTVGALDVSGKIPTTGFVFPGFSPNQSTWKVNFGNGYFGTSSIGSPQSDGSGLGKFQYSPPSGYFAICTKDINTYG